MESLKKVKNYIDNLDEKDFKKYGVIFFVVLIVLLSFLVYRYYSSISQLRQRNSAINRIRLDVKDILTRYELVLKQKKSVEDILAKTKDFKIVSEFDQILTKVGLLNNKTQEPEPVTEDVLEGYSEIKLYATLGNIDMKQLSELLNEIEKQERIYTKEVEAEKTGDLLTVKLTIATLEKKSETAPPATE